MIEASTIAPDDAITINIGGKPVTGICVGCGSTVIHVLIGETVRKVKIEDVVLVKKFG